MSDIFQEVDEEVRSDRLKQFWRAYGSYVIATAVVIVLVTSGRVIWKNYTESRAERESESFASAVALETSGKTDEAIAAYNDLSQNASTGVAVLARLRAAATLLSAGKEDEAIAAYDALSADTSADREIRDLGALNAASLMMNRDPSDDVRMRLEKLAVDDGAWKYSAKELLGLMSFRQGDLVNARVLFMALAENPETPNNIRSRVSAFLAILDAAGVVEPTAETSSTKG